MLLKIYLKRERENYFRFAYSRSFSQSLIYLGRLLSMMDRNTDQTLCVFCHCQRLTTIFREGRDSLGAHEGSA